MMSEPDMNDISLRDLTVRHVKAGYSNIYKYALALEAKLSKMERAPTMKIADGDVWLIFPDAMISIESICNSRAPGPIVKKNLRAWRDKALAGGVDGEGKGDVGC